MNLYYLEGETKVLTAPGTFFKQKTFESPFEMQPLDTELTLIRVTMQVIDVREL